MSDDAPKYKDHDFPYQYKTIPDRIMILGNTTDTAASVLYDVKFSVITNKEILPIIIGSSTTNVTAERIVIGLQIDMKEGIRFFSTKEISDKSTVQSIAEYEGENVPYEELEENDIRQSNIDKLGQPHLPYPHTGPSIIYLRNIFHSSTCLEHINDLYPICREAVKSGLASVTVIYSR